MSSTYTPAPGHRFDVGDAVSVKRSYPPGHRRTPYYIRGKQGVIERICGAFPNPEEIAYGFDGEPKRVLYRVRFRQCHVWQAYCGPAHDIIQFNSTCERESCILMDVHSAGLLRGTGWVAPPSFSDSVRMDSNNLLEHHN